MKQNQGVFEVRVKTLFFVLCSLLSLLARGQQNIIINMAPIDGVALTPDNVLHYQVQASSAGSVLVKGAIRYRNSNLNLSYSFHAQLVQGLNTFTADVVHPQWQVSEAALQDLFFIYKILPQGTFEYCVTITPGALPKEASSGFFDECLYHRANDLFLINLIDPDNNAKLKEYNPILTWIANYSFSNDLTYKIRIAEIKQGQNPVNAVMRNQPVYTESNLMQNSIVYPLYAKPLKSNQPYAWTVDAYYRGILLGGSEAWQFIIPDDTLPTKFPANRSYIDIKRENGTNKLNIMGEMKIKYLLDKYRSDVLKLSLINQDKEDIPLKPKQLTATYGDNRYILNFKDSCNLKHLKDYTLMIHSNTGEQYSLPFTYINPEFVR